MSQHIDQLTHTSGLDSTSGLETKTIWEKDIDADGIDDCTLRFEAEVIFNTAAGASGSAVVARTFKRFGGTLAAVGNGAFLHPLTTDLALALAGVTWDLSGNVVRLRFTGVLAQDLTVVYYIGWRTGEFG